VTSYAGGEDTSDLGMKKKERARIKERSSSAKGGGKVRRNELGSAEGKRGEERYFSKRAAMGVLPGEPVPSKRERKVYPGEISSPN